MSRIPQVSVSMYVCMYTYACHAESQRECLYMCVYVQHTHMYLYVCMYVCHGTTAEVDCFVASTLSLLVIDVCVRARVCVCCVQFWISRYMKYPHSVALRQMLHRLVLCRYPIV